MELSSCSPSLRKSSYFSGIPKFWFSMRLFELTLKYWTIFGNRTAWVDAQATLPIELAITFQADKAFIPQLVARLQKLRRTVSAISHHNDLKVSKEGFECSQLLNGDFNWSLLGWDTLDISGRNPATGNFGQEDHLRKLPTNA